MDVVSCMLFYEHNNCIIIVSFLNHRDILFKFLTWTGLKPYSTQKCEPRVLLKSFVNSTDIFARKL